MCAAMMVMAVSAVLLAFSLAFVAGPKATVSSAPAYAPRSSAGTAEAAVKHLSLDDVEEVVRGVESQREAFRQADAGEDALEAIEVAGAAAEAPAEPPITEQAVEAPAEPPITEQAEPALPVLSTTADVGTTDLLVRRARLREIDAELAAQRAELEAWINTQWAGRIYVSQSPEDPAAVERAVAEKMAERAEMEAPYNRALADREAFAAAFVADRNAYEASVQASVDAGNLVKQTVIGEDGTSVSFYSAHNYTSHGEVIGGLEAGDRFVLDGVEHSVVEVLHMPSHPDYASAMGAAGGSFPCVLQTCEGDGVRFVFCS
jgi:hypothetical protein